MRNRIVMAPMTRTSATDDGVPTPKMVEYYGRRARGGTSLIITEGTYTDSHFSKGYFNEPGIVSAEQIAGWRRVVDAVHREGAAIALQLFHAGRLSALEVLQGRTPRAPSAIAPQGEHSQAKHPYVTPQAMSLEEIKEAVEGFGQAAEQAREAGFDAVELHGAHGYLLDQFVWEDANQRTDAYGGSLQKRLRLPVEGVREVRRRLGHECTIIYRFSMWKLDDYDYVYPGGVDDLQTIVTTLADAGVDIFHVSTHEALAPVFGAGKTLAHLTKEFSEKPVIAVGKIRGSAPAVKLLNDDHADLIAIGKWLIANPDSAEKVRQGCETELKAFDPTMLADLV